MGLDDRHYVRGEHGGSPFARMGIASVVTWLLCINIGVFLLALITAGSMRGDWLRLHEWGNYNISQAVQGLQVWRFLTYQFLHGGFLHLLCNMIVLFFFGPMMEQWWGSRRFLAFYLLCGLAGAVVFSIMAVATPWLVGEIPLDAWLVGASGSIFGILIGCAVLYPHLEVRLLIPPIPMKMRTLAIVVMAIVFLSLLAGAPNAGGEAAHLGGAALGFLLVRYPHWLNAFERISVASPRASVNRMRQRSRESSLRKRVEQQQALDREVDRILAKVAREGMQSLTRKEKRTLQQATEERRES